MNIKEFEEIERLKRQVRELREELQKKNEFIDTLLETIQKLISDILR